MTVRVPALLEEFAREMRALGEAHGVTVLLHLEPAEREGLLLAHDGEGTVPELADEDAAWALVSSADQESDQPDAPRLLGSADPAGVLLCLPLARILARPQSDERSDERREFPVVHTAPDIDGSLWIGLLEPSRPEQLLALFTDIETAISSPQYDARELGRFVVLSARLAWQVYHLSRTINDPVSRLPGRMEFEVFLQRALVAAQENRQPLVLLLTNPDDFVMVNHRFGRQRGDRVVREIADRLRESVRQTDAVFRYGGAAFAVVLTATDARNSDLVANKLRRGLSEEPYLAGELELTFTLGGAIVDLAALEGDELDTADVVQRADNALNTAKLSGGGKVLLSEMSASAEGLNHFDPMRGIFTTDTEKDYRNLLVLWETVALVSTTPDPDEMASSFVDRLALRFRPDRIALIREQGNGMVVQAGNVLDHSATEGRRSGANVRLEEAHQVLIHEAWDSGRVERERRGDSDSPLGTTSYAVPLLVGDKQIGCLLLDGINRRLQLDSSDTIFLKALADQLAVALDRAELSVNWIREKDQESRDLREEVDELRKALQPSRMVYESIQMHELLGTVRRVAPTDATVLIIGESGTGKEMLAHAVHEFSARRDQAFVTVDCGAITQTLLEAELFGHVKGAYTGAESASPGRILQADGGTLFLDEIGELPLDLQTKLLRFVQERQITPVGGSKTHHVDVRIVAATNRELKEEVARGRFRSDLYYRLQVVAVQAIPLRHRPDDILPLARFFLDKFSSQYDRPGMQMAPEAERLLLDHPWPGNVRELQHTVLRAVLMVDGQLLRASDLELHGDHGGDLGPELPYVSEGGGRHAGADAPRGADEPSPERLPEPLPQPARPGTTQSTLDPTVQSSGAGNAQDPWTALAEELGAQVDEVLRLDPQRPAPIGRWLQQDLILAASEVAAGVSRQAARLVGIPESTFRRQLDKAQADAHAGLGGRSADWTRVQHVLMGLFSGPRHDESVSMLDASRAVLLEIVQRRVADSVGVGAALMGVTPPTYKRWVDRHAA